MEQDKKHAVKELPIITTQLIPGKRDDNIGRIVESLTLRNAKCGYGSFNGDNFVITPLSGCDLMERKLPRGFLAFMRLCFMKETDKRTDLALQIRSEIEEFMCDVKQVKDIRPNLKLTAPYTFKTNDGQKILALWNEKSKAWVAVFHDPDNSVAAEHALRNKALNYRL